VLVTVVLLLLVPVRKSSGNLLRNEQHSSIWRRAPWAHVLAWWWPAFVMESAVAEDRKEGYVRRIFRTGEVSTRDTSSYPTVFARKRLTWWPRQKGNIRSSSACRMEGSKHATRRRCILCWPLTWQQPTRGLNVIGKRRFTGMTDLSHVGYCCREPSAGTVPSKRSGWCRLKYLPKPKQV
jgi:hypothetical protein